MLSRLNQERCYELLNIYGPWPQLMMVIEECSELQKECCKMFREPERRGFVPTEGLKEELVDVIVMVTQAVLMANLSIEEINAMAQAKLDRVLQRG